MTGLAETSSSSAAAVTEELPELGTMQLYELQYPVAELEYPSYKVAGVVTSLE